MSQNIIDIIKGNTEDFPSESSNIIVFVEVPKYNSDLFDKGALKYENSWKFTQQTRKHKSY